MGVLALPNIAIVVAAVIAAVLACGGAALLVRGSQRRWQALDDTSGGLRKLHAIPTPRIGGVAVALGVFGGAVMDWAITGRLIPWLLLGVCLLPAFVWGLIEDLSKRGAVLPRLVLPAVAAALGFILLDARIAQLDIPGFDNLLGLHAFAFIFTLFAVTGVTHALNVIDGLNGLAGMSALLASIGLAIVAAAVQDALVVSVACVLAASIVGFLPVNYPFGRIFLGDGGAYLVGILLALLSVLLVQRNSEVSPWFPMMLLAYPIWETVFSMYRRKTRGVSAAHADALHLHTLVYRRVVRWRGYSPRISDKVARNSVASLCLWILPLTCLALGLAFWDDSIRLQFSVGVFVLVYILAYRSLVRFNIPAWLIVRAKPAQTMSSAVEDDIFEATRRGR